MRVHPLVVIALLLVVTGLQEGHCLAGEGPPQKPPGLQPRIEVGVTGGATVVKTWVYEGQEQVTSLALPFAGAYDSGLKISYWLSPTLSVGADLGLNLPVAYGGVPLYLIRGGVVFTKLSAELAPSLRAYGEGAVSCIRHANYSIESYGVYLIERVGGGFRYSLSPWRAVRAGVAGAYAHAVGNELWRISLAAEIGFSVLF